jgi:hypothetical protein
MSEFCFHSFTGVADCRPVTFYRNRKRLKTLRKTNSIYTH